MKMTKKILLGAAALVAALAFVGCGAGDDDPNKMIKGNNSSYSIDYTNETDDTSRGYNTTAQKHAGALVKISIADVSTDADPNKKLGGVMGIIFGLEGNEEDKNAKDFFVAGVRKNGTYYVSKYTGVVDINANNFGAPTDAKQGKWSSDGENGEKEFAYVELKSENKITLNSEDDYKSVYFYYVCTEEGTYEWKFLNVVSTEKTKGLTDTEFKNLVFDPSTVLAEGTISREDTGYTGLEQRKLAVYANVYAQGTLVGNWDIVGTYKEAEIIEE